MNTESKNHIGVRDVICTKISCGCVIDITSEIWDDVRDRLRINELNEMVKNYTNRKMAIRTVQSFDSIRIDEQIAKELRR